MQTPTTMKIEEDLTQDRSITLPMTPNRLPEDRETPLLDQLRSQIDYYFSFDNLSRDTFLQSQLTSAGHAGSVATEIVANFPKIKDIYASFHGVHGMRLPADTQCIARCLKESQITVISDDGKWISPVEVPDFHSISVKTVVQGLVVPPPPPLQASCSPASHNTSASSFGAPIVPILQPVPRTTAIVRELPLDCTIEEIVQVFTTTSGAPENVKLEFGNTWYVSFATETAAIAAVAAAWGKTMRGHPIQACMKSETPVQLLASNSPTVQVFPMPYSPQAFSLTQSPAFSYASYDSSVYMEGAPCLPESIDSSFCSYEHQSGTGIPVEVPMVTSSGRKKRKNKKHSKRRKSGGSDEQKERNDTMTHNGVDQRAKFKSSLESCVKGCQKDKHTCNSAGLVHGNPNLPIFGEVREPMSSKLRAKQLSRDFARVFK